jgi:hypothetical protein
MSLLNGAWLFYYSVEQAKDNNEKRVVMINGKEKEYTECVHVSNTTHFDYKTHKSRYEDSEEIGLIINPVIKKL